MKRFLPIIFTLLATSSLFANQPTVGVAMSGGGAKGLYHIGVLEALEQEGIPIDYVTGTSMGAVIAALYATGFTTEQMRELALSGELESWAMGRIDHNYGYYFHSESRLHSEDPMLSFRLDPKSKAKQMSSVDSLMSRSQRKAKRLPQSLIPSLQIDLALSELFTPATTICEGDFTKLMVPFLCVASNVTKAEAKIITGGDLGKAVRASMALPIAYSPIIDDNGDVLFDGGIYDNLPWKPLQESFDPDLLIASSCDIEYDGKRSALSLTDQVYMLTMMERDYNLPENGVMVERLVDGNMLDFSRANEIIDMGYQDTKAKIDEMAEVIDLHDRLPASLYDQRRAEFNEKKREPRIKQVDISGVSSEQKNYLLRLLNRAEKRGIYPEGMTFDQLRSGLYPSLMSGDFATTYPSMSIDTLSGSYNFEMEMSNRPQIELSIGGNISSTPFNQLYVGVEYTAISRVAKSLFGELYIGPLYNTGRFGGRIDFYYKAPLFIDLYYNFATKALNHGSFGNLTEVDNIVSLKSRDNYISLGIGSPISRRSLITVRGNFGIATDKGSTSFTTNVVDNLPYTLFDEGKVYYAAGRVSLDHNRLNNIQNPTRGDIFTASVIGVFGSERSYGKSVSDLQIDFNDGVSTSYSESIQWIGAKINFAKYFEVDRSRVFSFGVTAEGVITNIPDLTSQQARRAVLPYYAPNTHSNQVYMPDFAAYRYLAAGVMGNLRLWKDLSLRANFNTMFSDKYDSQQYVIHGEGYRLESMAQLSMVYVVPITTISLAMTKYGIYDKNNLYLTFNLGRAIFSPRGTYY